METGRVDAQSPFRWFDFPGPQKLGTGGTLNLMSFRGRTGPTGEMIEADSSLTTPKLKSVWGPVRSE